MLISFVLISVLATVCPTYSQENGMFWWLQSTSFKQAATTALPFNPQMNSDENDISKNSEEGDEENNDDVNDVINSIFVFTTSTLSPREGNRNSTVQEEPKIFNAPPPTLPAIADDAGCVCVEYYLCDSNNTIITDGGGGLIDVRFGADRTCPGVQVCCGLPPSLTPQTPPSNTIMTPRTPPSNNQTTPGISDIVTSRNPITQKPFPFCGVRGGGIVSRIRNDESDNSTYFGEFPWMLALLRAKEINGKLEYNTFQCGAALIHPQVALTAAHCVTSRKESDLKIRAGEWDTQSNSEPVPHQERTVKSIIRHPQFYSGALYNDIALLILDEPLEFNVNIQPICLPEQDAVYTNSRCVATGWGLNEFGRAGKFQMTLKKVELPIVDSDTCQAELRNSRLGSYFHLHRSFVCAGGESGRDTCRGDGGGPLACFDSASGTYVQVGIVSWGIGCGENGLPAAYTNVPLFRKWIEENLQSLGFM